MKNNIFFNTNIMKEVYSKKFCLKINIFSNEWRILRIFNEGFGKFCRKFGKIRKRDLFLVIHFFLEVVEGKQKNIKRSFYFFETFNFC